MEELQGYVDHIVFRNADNGYTVLNLISDEDEITCVGIFPVVTEGEILLLHGEYTSHPTYGEQFQMKSYETKPPEDVLSMERYLASGAIKGIGVALAARIVRRFKNDTFRIMEEEPERLAEVKGISERMAMEISNQMVEKKDLRDAMIFLEKYGISTNLAVKIYQAYGQEIYSVIRENPYRMAEEVSGIGFKIADEIASRAGIRTDSDFRIRSGIYNLTGAATLGHTYLPREELLRYANQLGWSRTHRRPYHEPGDGWQVELKEEAYLCEEFTVWNKGPQVCCMRLNQVYDDAAKLAQAIARISEEEQMELDEWQAGGSVAGGDTWSVCFDRWTWYWQNDKLSGAMISLLCGRGL